MGAGTRARRVMAGRAEACARSLPQQQLRGRRRRGGRPHWVGLGREQQWRRGMEPKGAPQSRRRGFVFSAWQTQLCRPWLLQGLAMACGIEWDLSHGGDSLKGGTTAPLQSAKQPAALGGGWAWMGGAHAAAVVHAQCNAPDAHDNADGTWLPGDCLEPGTIRRNV